MTSRNTLSSDEPKKRHARGLSDRFLEPATRKPAIDVVRMTDHHVGAVAEFLRAVWDPDATGDSVRLGRARSSASNPATPGVEAPTFLFLSDGRVLGYLTTIPMRIWSGGAETPAHWMKGFMVLPEYRNGPIGFLLLKEAVRHLDCALVITVQPASYKLFEAVGFARVGVMSNHVRLISPARVLSRLDPDRIGLSGLPSWLRGTARIARRGPLPRILGSAAAGVLAVWTTAARVRSFGVSVTLAEDGADPRELDALWRSVRGSVGATSVRDGRYIRWRYGDGRGAPYRFVTVRERSQLVGLAVVRRPSESGDPRLSGLGVATLSDVLFAPHRKDIGLALLAGAEAAARGWEADAVLCSSSHSALRTILPAHAYLPLPGTLHFLARDPRGEYALPNRLDDWWLTRGDSNADEIF